MNNYIVIFLSLIAEFNAFYLTNWAYIIKKWQETSSFCDINATFSCSSVFNFDFAWFFWIPFSEIAIAAYWIIILITILWMKKKLWWFNHFKALFAVWIWWLLFNSYIIYNEVLVSSYCLLCLMCTVILGIITYIAFKNMKDKKIIVISA